MTGRPSLDRRGVFLENDAPPLLRPVQSTPAKIDLIKSTAEAHDAAGKVATQDLVHHGTVGTLDIMEIAENLATVVNIISFTVPIGQLAVITHFALVCNNPMVTMSNLIVWKLLVNGGALPNMTTTVLFNSTGYRTNVGNVHRPMAITPFVAQSSQTVTIQIRPSVLIAGDNIAFVARLVGRLVNPGNVGALSLGGSF